ncbi:MAG: glycosyltransferase [Candidatus Sericytochromatia bacterium]
MNSLGDLYPQLKNVAPSTLPKYSVLAHLDMMMGFLILAFSLYTQKKLSFYHLGEKHFYSNLVGLSEKYDSLELARTCLLKAQIHFQSCETLIENNNLNQLFFANNNSLFYSDYQYFSALIHFLVGDISKGIDLAKKEIKNKNLNQNLLDIYKFMLDFDLNKNSISIFDYFFEFNLFFPYSFQQELLDLPINVQDRSASFKLKMADFKYAEEYGFDSLQIKWRASLVNQIYCAEYPGDKLARIVDLGFNDSDCYEALNNRFCCLKKEERFEQSIDILIDWNFSDFHSLSDSLSVLREGGLCLIAVPRSENNPEWIREKLENEIQGTCYLIDRESFSDFLVVYGFKNQKINVKIKLLVLTRTDSVQTIGGADLQLFKSRAYLKNAGVRADITLACRLDLHNYDCVYVVGYYHELYKIKDLSRTSLPKLCMPIASLFFEESIYAEEFVSFLDKSLKEKGFSVKESIESLFKSDNIRFFRHSMLKDWADKLGYNQIYYTSLALVCDYFIPQSTKEMALLFPEGSSKEFEIVFNGCDYSDLESIKSAIFVEKYKIKDYVICLGRIQPNKNQLFLCCALRDTDIPIVLVGKEFYKDYLKLCQMLGSQHIYHFDYLPDDLLRSAIQNARVFVLPSFSEVSPLSSLEAAMLGVPVVLTTNSGQDEQFADAFYYCDPWNIQDIRDVTLQAYYAKDKSRSKKSKKISEASSSWSKMANKLANVIYMLVGRAQGDDYLYYQDKWLKYYPTLQPLESSSDGVALVDSPGIAQIPDLRVFLAQGLEPKQLNHLFLIANTDFCAFQLEKLGFKNSLSQLPDSKQAAYVGGVSLLLEDACQKNLLCLYDADNNFAWQETLAAYIEAYTSEADVVLFISDFDLDGNSDIELNILNYLNSKEYDLENIPNISILTEFKQENQLNDLFCSVDVLVFPIKMLWGYESILYKMVYSQKTVITHQFNRDFGNNPNLISLVPFASLCQLMPAQAISVSVPALVQALKWVDPRH